MTLARFTKIKLQIQILIGVAQFLEEKLKMAGKAVFFSSLVKRRTCKNIYEELFNYNGIMRQF